MHFQLIECVGHVWPCSVYAVHMAQTEQQEMKRHRSLNATTCNFVLLTEYLWKMEKNSQKPSCVFPVAVYFCTLCLILCLYMIHTWVFFCFVLFRLFVFSFVLLITAIAQNLLDIN